MAYSFWSAGLEMALNSAMHVCARVQIQVCPESPLVFSHDLLEGLRTGFLVASPLRIACVFLHVERGRGSKRVWRSLQTIHSFMQSMRLGREQRNLSLELKFR
jgi:hypothetical protein